jgi:phosphatidylserine/phosphatidylglycerophosphate/cardiolipin synthase-like enzyme
MPNLGGLAPIADQLARRLFAVFDRRRHRLTLRRSAAHVASNRSAREATWWGSEPIWYPGGTPPRQHNRVTPLVDGERYFAALAAALAQAQEYVYVVGWCVTPHIPLGRGDPDEIIQKRLCALLDDVARRGTVRFLVWSGSPFLLQPTVSTTRAAQQLLDREISGDFQCRLDETARFGHSHHQKAIVIDGQVAFVGGMDLTTFHGDRWDTNAHPLRVGPNWHDVQLQLQGEAVADVEQNFRQRWLAVGGDKALPHREPVVDPAWQTPAQIVRTIPSGRYDFSPLGEFGIHHAYTQLLRRARRLIYLESQYLWSHDVMDALIAAMNAPRSEPLRIVIVLPAYAYDGKWDNDHHVKVLRALDRGRGIVSVYSLYSSGVDIGTRPFIYRPTYVHAKVAIVDDEWLTVGSANLNARGMVTDSEINALVHDPAVARQLRIDLWAEHLGLPRDEVERADPIALVDDVWTQRGAESVAIVQQASRPLRCAIHDYLVGRMPGVQLLEQIEAQTFDR